ncbi:hypothetical protein [Sphingomonas quercus]|uniref:Uncharacterized protein n=1 Tax=Sphingomonas quercus TaxID=2842451 RepID=A0ABS6BHR3_9SPHN|nr:hypothetical protein [Sphingomonas quercus]MBU3076794.1 hypothetical protein [Sphingomonas quercus]
MSMVMRRTWRRVRLGTDNDRDIDLVLSGCASGNATGGQADYPDGKLAPRPMVVHEFSADETG